MSIFSVVSFLHPPLNVNDTITFKLMKRLRRSLLAYPIDHNIAAEENTLYNMSHIESDGIYSKLVLADRSQVMAIIERESTELREQVMNDENCPEKCFIEQAITLLKDREGFVLKSELSEIAGAIQSVKLEEVPTCDIGDLDVSHSSSLQQPAKYHYFYQGN